MENAGTPEYTLEQVAQHDKSGDAWIILHGKVYDVAGYLDDHPGGGEVLLEVAGSDATSDFDMAGHSDDAKKSLQQWQVGTLAGHITRASRTSRVKIAPVFAKRNAPAPRGGTKSWGGEQQALAFFVSIGAGLILISTTNKASINLTLPSQGMVLQGGSPQLGIAAALVGCCLLVWVGFVRVRHAIFHYKGAFEYEPYYEL